MTAIKPIALTSLLLALALPVHAQEGRPPQTQTFADQQQAQAWATQKLAVSPRRKEWVTIQQDGRTLHACVIYPDAKPKAPVVLVLHEVFGLTDSTLNTADEVAAMGYVVVAPDILSGFGPNGGGTSAFATTHDAGEAMTAIAPETMNANLDAWAGYALALPQAENKLAIVGLSWGGGEAFRYAADPSHDKALKLISVFYDVGPPAVTQGPSRMAKDNPPVSVEAIDVPVYGFYGSTDSRVMNSLSATRDWMAKAGKAYDPVVYDGADHAFMRVGEDPANTNPANAAAVQASLARLKALLGGM
ncbi:MAG: dienelactone hydrolase family protein [Asticcacaulis sp.]|uniref:dienelactone hydrolase family protein n=1 Tax=Asticcacaulis sp. TaxID=1872648 RepID=UPI0039E5C96E